jgi:hypothetical protein
VAPAGGAAVLFPAEPPHAAKEFLEKAAAQAAARWFRDRRVTP